MAKSETTKRVKHSWCTDKISSLPEPLLSRILSLLPTKYAVATSLLSARWRFLWTSITNLDFDDEEAVNNYPKKSTKKSLIERRKKFAQFVNRVLLLLNPPQIQNFHLKCHHQPSDPLYLDSWICAAIGRNIQHLNLELSQPMELPMSHFHCKTLSVLKMNGDIHFNVYASPSISFPNLLTLHLSKTLFTITTKCSVNFPRLKDLLLDSVKYTSEESVHKLFASCPSLENLVIKRRRECDWDNALSLTISIPSLISLTIDFKGAEFIHHPEANEFELEIDTPALKYLIVEDDSMCCFTSGKLSSLLEARIKIDFHRLLTIDANYSYSTNIFKFIRGLSNAKFLLISGRTLEAISSISEANIAPVFSNLTRLELSCCSCGDWSFVLRNLLERMPYLEHLVFNGIYYYGSHESESWWAEPLCVPSCLRFRVTTISFTGRFCGCVDELELVRYILKKAKVLKMLTVESIGGSDAEKCKFMQKILTTPKRSKKCQVEFGVKGASEYEHPHGEQKKQGA